MDDKLVDEPPQVRLRGKAALRAIQVSLVHRVPFQPLVGGRTVCNQAMQ